MWRAHDVEVHFVPLGGYPSPQMRELCDARGCITHRYEPGIFAGQTVVSFCNGEFLRMLPEIASSGKPRCTVWANCMTWPFDAELAAHRAGLIDLFAFQSQYQRSMLLPHLEPFGPVRELTGYRPFFSLTNASQRIAFRDPTTGTPTELDYFGIGRISRDDAAKYPADIWRTLAQVTAPVPVRAFMLGFGDNAKAKCGKRPPCNWLDWQTWEPGALPVAEFWRKLHVLIHGTGGSRENWPRTVIEAMAAGVVVVAENAYGLPELIEDGVTGFLCNSAAEMSHVASLLAWDDEIRQQVVRAAHQRFLAEHANAALSLAAWRELLD
ncbi:MAG: glycosyltransferase [Bradyrhizobium sp.]|nr:glycosyltransferase [Bradyrhizobium sp.]